MKYSRLRNLENDFTMWLTHTDLPRLQARFPEYLDIFFIKTPTPLKLKILIAKCDKCK